MKNSMDYEKAYKDALDRAKNQKKADTPKDRAIDIIFPELRESEDERIRKWLVELVQNQEPKMFIEVKKMNVFSWLEKQKESKVVEFDHFREQKPAQTVDEKEYIRTIKGIIADFIRDKQPKDVAFYQKIYDWLDGRHIEQMPAEIDEYEIIKKHITGDSLSSEVNKRLTECGWYVTEQKPAEKQDYSGLNDLERAIHRGFLCAGVENVPISIIKETAQECLEQMKPAEWSKNDTVFLNEITDFFENKTVRLQHDIDMYAHWLKSLPKRFNLQPKQEWSEEDEKFISILIDRINEWYLLSEKLCKYEDREHFSPQHKDWLIEKIKSLRPQPKQDGRYMEGYLKGWKDAEDAYNKSVTFHYDFNHRLSCYEGGPCTNPQMDCVNCPRKGTTGMPIFTSPNTTIGRSTAIPHWKPSEEQIYSLGTVVKGCGDCAAGSVGYNLKELYEQLKKLI